MTSRHFLRLLLLRTVWGKAGNLWYLCDFSRWESLRTVRKTRGNPRCHLKIQPGFDATLVHCVSITILPRSQVKVITASASHSPASTPAFIASSAGSGRINSVTAVTMSPSTSGTIMPLGTEDFDVGVGGRHGLGDQRSKWLEAAVCCEVVGGMGCGETNVMTFRERGGEFNANMVPNDLSKPKLLLQRDYQLTHGIESMQMVESACTAVGGTGMADGGFGGECVGHVECRNGSADPQINISASGTQEHPSSWHVKTLITQGPVASSVASKADPKPIVSRTKQDQRTRSTVALTRLGLHAPPSVAGVKAHVCKIFSGNVAANPLFGIFGTTSPGGRLPPPAGRLTSAAAAARTPPRPWEVRVLVLALLLAASVNGKSSINHTKVLTFTFSSIFFFYFLHRSYWCFVLWIQFDLLSLPPTSMSKEKHMINNSLNVS